MELTLNERSSKMQLCIFAVILLAFLIFLQFNPLNFSTHNMGKRPFSVSYLENICMDNAKDGILYKSPEMFCHNGPLYYSALGRIKSISPGSFESGVFLISSLLYLAIFLLFYNITKKEIGRFPLLAFFLYLLLIPAYNIFRFDLSDLLAFFLFFAGFYVLFYTDSRLKEIIGSIFLTNSFLTKQTYIFPLLVAFFLYSTKNLKIITCEDKKLGFNKSDASKFLLLLMPSIALVMLSNKFFPLFLAYTFYLGAPSGLSTITDVGLKSTILNIFSQESMTLLLFLYMFLVSSYFMFKKRKIVILFAFFSIIAISYLFVLNSSVFEYKRLIFIVPFFILMCCEVLKEYKHNAFARYLIAFIVLTLLFPVLKVMYLNFQMSSLEQEVGYVWSSFPEQHMILADKDRLMLYANKESNVTLISRGRFFGEDISVSKASESLGLIDKQSLSVSEYALMIRFFEGYIKGISNKNYSSIVALPGGEGYDISKLILFMKQVSRDNNISFETIFPYPCGAFVPSVEDKCKACDYEVEAYFLDVDDCNSMKDSVEKYYRGRLSAICKRDKTVWQFVANVTMHNGSNLTEKCEDGGNLMGKYENRFYLSKTDLFLILAAALIIIVCIKRSGPS